MATVRIPLPVQAFVPAAANGAQLKCISGTSFPVCSWAFDAGTDESIFSAFIADAYGSENLTLTLLWFADTASSGNVVWEAQVAAITPDTDSQDVETKALATLNFVSDAHLGTVGQRVHTCAITISNTDSIAAGDFVTVRIARDADGTNATDDMTGDAQLLSAEITYSDT